MRCSRTTSTRIGDGEAQYTLLTNERGGIVDDLIVYRDSTTYRFLLVVNASNRDADFGWLKEREIRGSDVRDVSDEYALLAVQGPRAFERLGLPERHAVHVGDGRARRRRGDGQPHRATRASEGVELLCMADDAPALWDAVVARGATPCGLGARDTLRLEVCYPLHGNDITPETDAISAGLGWACALDKEFTGVDELRRDQGATGPSSKLVAVRDGRSKAIPRQGMPIDGGGDGHVGLALADARRRHRHGLRARGAAPSRTPS